jgi:thiosulfate dehydrogenase
MTAFRATSLIALAVCCVFVTSARAQSQDPPTVDLTAKPAPDIAVLPDDEHGRLVRYGRDLVVETYKFIGPEVKDASMRYAGTNMSCQSCHLGAATVPYAAPLTGASAAYPQFMPRFNATYSMADRVNACMLRSMAGKAIPVDSREMKAFVAYIDFLSEGVPKGAKRIGMMTKSTKEPQRPVDLVHGAKVYQEKCAQCHGEDGLGKRRGVKGDALGYEYPPQWGPDASSEGASMFRLLTVMEFVLHNMPLGVTWDRPQLTLDEAYDVAAFIVSHPHQARSDAQKGDFPNPLDKPPDFAFGPYADSFTELQHKYGPFDPIRAEVAALKAKAKALAK